MMCLPYISLIGAMSTGLIIGLSVSGGVLLILLILLFIFVPMRLWFRALVSGAHVSMIKLVGMRLRHVDLKKIVLTYITAKKAGLTITVDELETHTMAGGDIERVVKALISAKSASLDLSNQTAKAIDLAGRDVYQAVRTSVVPKIIETPPISAMAKDGIELRVKAKVTVMSNMHMQIQGAGEETIIARVGEGIVTTVGSAASHKIVLENPDSISSTVLNKGLDSGTAFEIVSIDIADIDVGRNIGAELDIANAEAEKRIAEAKAEERKCMAIAAENEMKAKVQAMRAIVVQAEAEVPKALAKALASGKMSAMDYYNLQNVQADTSMRNAISKKESKAADGDDDENKKPAPKPRIRPRLD